MRAISCCGSLPNDSAMFARKIATTARLLCASPSYLARRGAPQSPDDLRWHSCLRIARRHQLLDRWRLMRAGETFEVAVSGPLSSGDGSVLYEWALSGEGISLEAHWDVADDLAAGRLVDVMPDYRGAPAELYAVFAPGKPVPPRIRLFADYLAKAFERIQQGDRDRN